MAFQSVEKFLNGLESELNKYAKSLRDQGFTSTNMLTFLKLKDLQNIPFVVPAPHRRMLPLPLPLPNEAWLPNSNRLEVNSKSKVHIQRQSILMRAKREKQMGKPQRNIKSKLQKSKAHLRQKRSFLMEHYRRGTIPRTTLFCKIS